MFRGRSVFEFNTVAKELNPMERTPIAPLAAFAIKPANDSYIYHYAFLYFDQFQTVLRTQSRYAKRQDKIIE
ncbi:MAG: hypothetical protein LBB48_09215 [Treponema sp.]|jgi:hypothetical protein|nr:hypothetical protein [Treponema sp.]